MNRVVKYLENCAKLRERGRPRRLVCTERLLLNYGRAWTPSPLPPRVIAGAPKLCFVNAARLALLRSSLRYVEGYAIKPPLPLPVEHAWCVDRHGRVVDNTWDVPETCQYFGVPFRSGFLRSFLRTAKRHGVLNCYELRYPIQQGNWPVEEWLETELAAYPTIGKLGLFDRGGGRNTSEGRAAFTGRKHP